MEIQKSKNKFSRKKIKWLFGGLFLIAFVIGLVFASKQLKKKGFSGLYDFVHTVCGNYLNGINASPERITIDIKKSDFKKLEKYRNQALERGVIINDLDGEYVPATVEYNGKKIDIKLRLKGHMTDHLQEDKWSFRIKVKEKDETFMGMKRFSIQHPGTRGYIYEWIYHEMMRAEDIIALRYKFINVTVNGEDWGIYAVEENFENELLENNHRIKGPILRYNPDLYWVNRYNQYTRSSSADEFASYYSANPEAYREDKVLADSLQTAYYLKGIALIEGLRSSTIKVSEAFDIPQLAKFHAIIDLVGGIHSIDWSDIKYYYNPVTSRLEPVAYESFTNLESRQLSAQYLFVKIDSARNFDDWHQMIFSDPLFFREYMKQLQRLSDKAYLKHFFDKIQPELKANLAILNKEFPYKKFDDKAYYKRQDQIRKIISPPKAIHAYLNSRNDSTVNLQIASIDALPVEIIKFETNGHVFFPENGPVILPSKQNGEFLKYEHISFKNDKDLKWEIKDRDSLFIFYSVLGNSEVKKIKVFPYPHTDSEFISTELKNKKGNVIEFAFLKINDLNKTITLAPGKNKLMKDLVIPQGYVFLAGSGTELDIINKAKIISYSPVVLVGEEDSPVRIYSSDSSSQGIIVISDKKSMIKNSVFSNFAAIVDPQWKRSAAITFYESDVEINDCLFNDFRSEDALNLIRSGFIIKNAVFRNMKDDGIDLDFSKGSILDCAFDDCKENAIDATFSSVELQSVTISGAKNKAVNIKDGSVFSIHALNVKNANIAVSAEDFSSADMNEITIINCKYGLIAYKNKPSAGHARINANNLSFKNVKEPYLVEKKSSILIDNKSVEKEVDDLEMIIKSK